VSTPPFDLETELERRLAADPDWQAGLDYGKPRRGHPEGAVKHHIADVLRNVDEIALDEDDRRRLRLAALAHDTFKYRAPESSAPVGSPGHHGSHARRFLERHGIDDDDLLEVVHWHDDAFAAWMGRRRDRARAEARARRLIDRLGAALPLFLRFFRADNGTDGKSPEPVEWFERIVRRAGASGPASPAGRRGSGSA
jgi:hypothetical protein